ncbi:Dolichyl-phosphate-mannose-protein mannosyltransferase [Mucilaginibacter pineti]|uniref:Dolichyl-phosphate-mannose-protein mannosyltransferase n=1 Tax=Mucilaginibacter pineti TaxID=1391627 RepID=A0A1G7I4R1_9SPHI|nr:glycosyltransferase family 39 protein [Mucilaginibacter pineti]SDF07721.1 Dolichyl-phosphate-mannose-protein mannosyltransferase [Mucilaginibacter pineti]
MPYKNRKSTYVYFILIFVFVKVILNLFAIGHFGFHRDEFLHLILADHLDWGYKEVPPFIAVVAKISVTLFGNSVFAARIFPTIFSGLIIWFTGLITVEFGGKKFAITLACLALIFSPAFAASGYLFQPVVFDQFWWLISVWLLIKYLNTTDVRYLYWLGAAVGFGMLTKYTMLFFTVALLIGILISKQRKLLFSWHILGAAAVTLLICMPNLIWQINHHFPVVTHMKTLRKEQLDYITPGEFIKQQLMVHGIALFVWLNGLAFLIFSFRLRNFQFLAIAYVLIFLFLLEMDGKNYYLFGAYPMLFAAGGFGFERLLKTSGYALRTVAIALFTLPNLVLFPMILPVLSLNQTLGFFRFAHKNISFFDFVVTWEDHKTHPTTQDYADMFGWDEMAKKVGEAYHNLAPDQQKQTIIYADNYGEAGALHHYRKQFNYPDVISLNSSFTLWAPDSLNCKYMIYVDDNDGENIRQFVAGKMIGSYQKLGEVQHYLSREKGTGIYLLIDIKQPLKERYSKELAKKRLE